MAKGTFYIARLVKGGRLTNELLLRALAKPTPILRGEHAWSFTDFQSANGDAWHYGKLTKYKPEGVVSIIDHEKNAEIEQPEPDLVVASSPFVYLPSFAAVAYLHIWNQIERDTFPRRFAEIVEASLDRFFVHCSLESISDLRSFMRKLSDLDSIQTISAKVRPPNPLFGPLWKNLRDYVKERNADVVKIDEQSLEGNLKTRLPEIASQAAAGTLLETPPTLQSFPIGDAAILMAADGYGKGRIVGRKRTAIITIRTEETQFNFDAERDTEPDALAERTAKALAKMEEERGLTHGGGKDGH